MVSASFISCAKRALSRRTGPVFLASRGFSADFFSRRSRQVPPVTFRVVSRVNIVNDHSRPHRHDPSFVRSQGSPSKLVEVSLKATSLATFQNHVSRWLSSGSAKRSRQNERILASSPLNLTFVSRRHTRWWLEYSSSASCSSRRRASWTP